MNNICLIGRLTKDAESRKTSAGKSVCSFTIAVDRKFKDADGNKVTDFFKCTAWNGQADSIVKYTHKGSRIGITGELQTEQWEKDGVKQYGVNIQVDTCQFLDSKEESKNNEEEDLFAGTTPVETGELPF